MSRFFGIPFLLVLLFSISPAFAGELFPLYPVIRPNVKFWEDVYSRYTTSQGILHDMDDLSKVYAVIDLVSWNVAGSAEINSERVKAEKRRISDILETLGSGQPPQSEEQARIAALFPKQRHTTYREAKNNIRLQIGQKDRFLEGVIRSGKYLGQIKQIFKLHGLPAELAYLAHVESSYNVQAYSKAAAAGLWQFTRATGKEYMTVDNLIDERYDPYLATQAAARLLKDNYEKLETWPLALTAYNHGRGGMLRAVAEKGTYEAIFTSYNQGAFKFASRNFYSEFLAALRVAKRLENDPKVTLDRPENTVTFRLKNAASSSALRSSFGVSREDFTRLNPALSKAILDDQKPVPKEYLLRLPASLKKPAASPTRKVAKSPQGQRAASLYTVKAGDTLFSIARAHAVPFAELAVANDLDRSAPLRLGQKITIPQATKGKETSKP